MDTLFHNTKIVVDSFMQRYSLKASEEFINYADKQLTEIFIKETGIKPSKNVVMALTPHYVGAPIYCEYIKPDRNGGRKLLLCLYVNHNWNPITILWDSKSGKQGYRLHDSDIDPDDIEFSFEKLDTSLYLQQLYPNQKLPFKTSHFSFELIIVRINLDCTISLVLKKSMLTDIETIKNEVITFINSYNLKSEKRDRQFGVIHNCKTYIIEENVLVNELDLGSTGVHFFRQFLNFLSKSNMFEKVTID